MSRLFINIYLDEDVDVLLAVLLRSQGWSAVTVHDLHRDGLPDEQQLEFAARNRLTLFTHNRDDYRELAGRWNTAGKTHSGIIIAVRRKSTYDLARRTILILDRTTADEMDNQVFYI